MGQQQRMSSSEARFVAAISVAKTSEAAWKALDELASSVVGHKLFTVSVTDIPAALVRRVYSNQPAAYPTSGTKPLRGNTGDWFEQVFTRRQIFSANTIEHIAKVFPDHEMIASLGLGSVINLPIVLGDDLAATVNLLDVGGHYTPSRVAEAEAALAIPARLCAALSLRFDPLTQAAA